MSSMSGAPPNAWMRAVRERVEKSRALYDALQVREPVLDTSIAGKLNRALRSDVDLLAEALREEENEDYVEEAVYLETEDSVRGCFHATDVLIFREQDIVRVNFGTDELFDREGVLGTLKAMINPHALVERPTLTHTDDGEAVVSIPLLLRGYWGWFGKRAYGPEDEKGEKKASVWEYRAEVTEGILSVPYISFYTLRDDGGLAWTYFPVSEKNTEKMEKLLS